MSERSEFKAECEAASRDGIGLDVGIVEILFSVAMTKILFNC